MQRGNSGDNAATLGAGPVELETFDPYTQFQLWFDAAKASEPNDPDAMALATVDAAGRPSVRMVLLKGVDRRGFVFYTNNQSRKGQELAATQRAALCLHWKSLRRQVRIEGPVVPVSEQEADAYFRSRSRGSRLAARASDQSRPLKDRATLLARWAAETEKFGETDPVPRPAHWSGWRVEPETIEFWSDGEFRLHDRFVFRRSGENWSVERLYP
ncbi:pyridoxamine 5'-phosphate oxidase [Roseiterribacter gracilis]|uniref:Pyridoxine/pyridoxamine 5'-phosphate oxidase n=1 Tax=Roseiterribacter gracilis TaxID=2812848 RepID=A0A8S8XFC1_9PROT|nr:pyridoxine/pyridoxamine 5'-phosphate oxidase [Rhodospirillales bacterium TMPK1]